MLEILQFIFGSFWRWLGAFLIIACIAEGLGGMFRVVVHRGQKR